MKLTKQQVFKMLATVECCDADDIFDNAADLEISISERDNWEGGDVIDVFTKYLNEFIELGLIVVDNEELELLK